MQFSGLEWFDGKGWKNNPEEALFYFIEKCHKVKILTDNSISCVTYVFYDLPKSITSPYVTVRSTNLNEPVNKILIKIGKFNSTIIEKNQSQKINFII